MVERHPVSDIMARSFRSAEKFRAGWEGWLEGARLAQLRFDVEDMVRVGVLRMDRTSSKSVERRFESPSPVTPSLRS